MIMDARDKEELDVLNLKGVGYGWEFPSLLACCCYSLTMRYYTCAILICGLCSLPTIIITSAAIILTLTVFNRLNYI